LPPPTTKECGHDADDEDRSTETLTLTLKTTVSGNFVNLDIDVEVLASDLYGDNDLDLDLEADGLAGSLSRNSVMQSTRAIPSIAIYKRHLGRSFNVSKYVSKIISRWRS